jgi:hypothetical protein
MRTLPASTENLGELSAAARDLNPRQREFIPHYVAEVAVKPNGAAKRAARKAGCVGKARNFIDHAYDVVRHPRIVADDSPRAV